MLRPVSAPARDHAASPVADAAAGHGATPSVTPGRGPARSAEDARHAVDLVLHLARREVAIAHRFTLLGWAWPLTRQLVQVAVLVFVFGHVLDLGIENFPVFVFSGLIAWTWFSSGLTAAATSVMAQRHLVFRARFPTIVVPIVAVTVPLIDVVMAIPVLVVMLVIAGELRAEAVLLPLLYAVQLLLVCGLAWLVAALTVYLRDVPNIVLVALNALFYLTPVFYSSERVPENAQWLLRLNPMTTLLDADRAVLLDYPFPPVGTFLAVVAFSIAVACLGYAVFRRLSPGFVDEL
jgi:lipopolysaccharide transport system permease protein